MTGYELGLARPDYQLIVINRLGSSELYADEGQYEEADGDCQDRSSQIKPHNLFQSKYLRREEPGHCCDGDQALEPVHWYISLDCNWGDGDCDQEEEEEGGACEE